MRYLITISVFFIFCTLGACGTYVPFLREWPDTSENDQRSMIREIIRSVQCDLSYTITRVILKDREEAPRRISKRRYTDYLFDWGTQVALNLTIVERTGVNPTALLTPAVVPGYAFTLAGGLSASSEATRLEKLNLFYTITDLYKPNVFPLHGPGREICRNKEGNKFGSPIVDIDLRIVTALEARLVSSKIRIANEPDDEIAVDGEKNVINHTISFKIVTSGTITPAWILVPATVNPGGSFFSTGRDRTHELVITFGPLDKKSGTGRRSLAPLAELTHINTQLQTGIGNIIAPFR